MSNLFPENDRLSELKLVYTIHYLLKFVNIFLAKHQIKE